MSDTESMDEIEIEEICIYREGFEGEVRGNQTCESNIVCYGECVNQLVMIRIKVNCL